MKKTLFVLIACLLSVGATCRSPLQSYASKIPQLFTYEGEYVSPDNTPMPDGVYDLVFSLYEAQSGGSAVWTETHRRSDGNGVQVIQGKFKVALGKSIPLPNFSANYWLAVVDPRSGKELVPREELGSVPYALAVADGSITAEKIADGAVTSTKMRPIYYKKYSDAEKSLNTSWLKIDALDMEVDVDKPSVLQLMFYGRLWHAYNGQGNNVKIEVNGQIIGQSFAEANVNDVTMMHAIITLYEVNAGNHQITVWTKSQNEGIFFEGDLSVIIFAR